MNPQTFLYPCIQLKFSEIDYITKIIKDIISK